MHHNLKRLTLVLLPVLLLLAACNTNTAPQNTQVPIIHSFTATPMSFTPGETVTLSWEVEHASNIHINGLEITLGDTTFTVTPAVETTYSLNATNPYGSATRQVTVTPKSTDGPREPTPDDPDPEHPNNPTPDPSEPTPESPGPEDPETPTFPDPTAVIFDFSDAIGLQTGTLEQAGMLTSQSSTRPSGLLKVTSSGSLVDPLVNGQVHVNHFVIRNGRIYLLLQPDYYGESDIGRCVLAEVDQHNQITCIDDELTWINASTLQFDEHGGVYYMGSTGSTEVLRRSFNGEITDYYTIRDTTEINSFYVTREGLVIMAGYTSGSIGMQSWLRTVDEHSNVHDLEWPAPYNPVDYGHLYQLYGFLPDGSLMARGPHDFRRILVHDGNLTVDTKTYAERFNAYENPEPLSGFQIASGQAVHLSQNGLTRIYPVMEDITLPYRNIITGSITHNMVTLAGRGESGQYRAGYYDLNTGTYTEILDGQRIEVARLLLQQDQGRIIMYGLNLNGNVPVLAEYDLNHRVLNVAPIGGELADQFEIIDWSINHVAPEPLKWTPETHFEYEADTGWYEGHVHFDATTTANLPFMNDFNWDFGDGHTSTGLTTTHFYEEPGTYTVTLEAINDHGNTAYYSTSITVNTPVINDLHSLPNLMIFDTTHGYYAYNPNDDYGLLGNGHREITRSLPYLIEELPPSTVTKFVQGNRYMLALTVDGTVYAWGQNRNGELGRPADLTQLYAPQAIPGLQSHHIVAIAIVDNTNFALTDEGDLYYWGAPSSSTASLGDLVSTHTPTLLVTDRFPENIIDITSGNNTTAEYLFFTTDDGNVYAWGRNREGRLGVSNNIRNIEYATRVDLDHDIVSIRAQANNYVTFFLTSDGQVYAAGYNGDETAGVPLTTETQQLYTPTLVPMPGNVAPIGHIAGGTHSSVFVVTTDDVVYAWGLYHSLPIDTTAITVLPTRLDNLPPATSIVRDPSTGAMLALHDGRLYSWYNNAPDIFIHTDRPIDDENWVITHQPYLVR